ncbi:MAG: CsbD family protein [Beijerinckiaceae bacterium]|nr:CsbD family protein [Beijerinckiaceae bacterium]
MDKDRTEGSMDQMKGKLKEGAGKITGDEKLKNEGRADQAKGKVQNTVGGIKDAVRGDK